MKSRMLAFFTILVFCLCVIEAAPVSLLQKSRQFIPPLPGYIPVYIRLGNTPLEEINLDLADAFRNYAVKQARLNNFRSLSENVVEDARKEIDFVSSLNNISLEDEEDKNSIAQTQRTAQHIQKIPRN